MKNFRHRTEVQIRFKDVDSMGHVNNANHFTYFELARVKYFQDIINETVEWSRKGIILASVSIDYRSPIFMHDKVIVCCRISRYGNTSFDFEYNIICVREGKEIIAAEGRSTQVCFDYEKNKPYPVPEKWKKLSENFESGN